MAKIIDARQAVSLDKNENISIGDLIWTDLGYCGPQDRIMKPKASLSQNIDSQQSSHKSLINKTSKSYYLIWASKSIYT